MKLRFISLLLAFAAALKAFAQDPNFVQFNSVPLFYNPGYTGSTGSPRLALSAKTISHNWNQLSYLSYDQAVKKLHGGLGIMVYNDHSKLSDYQSKEFSSSCYVNTFYSALTYAARFNVFKKLCVSPAVKIGYVRKDIRSNDDRYQTSFDGAHLYTTHNFDLSLGAVINTQKFHIGFAADHLNRPFTNPYWELNFSRKYTAQIGYTIQRRSTSPFSITPGLLFIRQGDISRLQANLSARYKFVALDIGVGSNMNAMIGYYGKKLMIGCSYGWLSYKNRGYESMSTYEVSLRYHFISQTEEKTIKEKPVKKYRVFRNRKRILLN
jgi:type IX secretion system PorP/SprF family membrane protein